MSYINGSCYAAVIAAAVLITACAGNNKPTDVEQQSAETAREETVVPNAAATAVQPTVPPAKPAPPERIPDFTFYNLNSGISFVRQDLAKEGNIVFILFDPGCSHCQQEAGELSTNYNKIKKANLYFVSMIDPAIMSTFFDTYAEGLSGQKNVRLLYDRKAEFINKIHVPDQYPATYIYGADGTLKEHWSGERDIDQIIASINQE